MKKYKNPYKKHIPVEEMTWAMLRKIKRAKKLHSINEVVEYLLRKEI